MKQLKDLVRKNIWELKPYSCARDEFKGEASVYLDANENPYGAPYNRYPDPRQIALKEKISKIKGVPADQIMLGNGSDEPIDLIYRIFCEPGVDNVVAIEPTYGMYGVCADVNNVEYRPIKLDDKFDINGRETITAVDEHTKVMWFCSPNNPTGNLLTRNKLAFMCYNFPGIVVIDEAYADFSSQESWLKTLNQFPNLIVLQTFSKAWGMASVRCGMAFASKQIIELFNKVKYPYNINLLTQQFVSERLDHEDEMKQQVQQILAERSRMAEELQKLDCVETVYPSEANFLLVKVDDAELRYDQLMMSGVIVRNRNKVQLCEGCLRITIGTPEENNELLYNLQ
ncbi:MAG: histidinol-phosphate transaminase [Paludibacteraceae bacterium]|nr:histidinol-phosphate transaminase [Paludibacteraceae bacterium]MBQ1751921.1 histidinol-phosphate transaminase [Paludibacteraceae bacterium]